jgi:zinc transport system ATP-binding protein
MTKEIVSVSNLDVHYGQEEALHNINFIVNEHDMVIILGPNGAGKSTLLKAILDLIPYYGIVTWYTKSIGYLPPQESLLKDNLPPLTVKDFFSLKMNSLKKVIDMLKEVGLSDQILSQQFATLSTGQFQRMMLAWVLIDEPSVLLLDEPFTGIDIPGQETVYSLLEHIWKKWQITILLVTHNINFMWKHATKVLCLNQQLIAYGAPGKTLTPEILKKVYGVEVSLYEHRHP